MVRKTILSAGLIAVAAFGLTGLANAADDLQIGNGLTYSGASGSDPVLINTGSDFGISFNGNGNGPESITDQILLAILIPNNGGKNSTTSYFGSTDPVTAITAYNTYPGTADSGTTSSFTGTGFGLGSKSALYQSNGFWGDLTGTTDLHAFLGAAFSSSINISNFSTFETSLGISVTDFGVYTIDATTGPVSSKGFIDVAIAGGLPVGSIVSVLTDTGYTLPWTKVAGANGPPTTYERQPLPIPATLPLVGGGLLGLGLIALRKRRRLSQSR